MIGEPRATYKCPLCGMHVFHNEDHDEEDCYEMVVRRVLET